MPLTLRWVNDDERDSVARTRALCYARGAKEIDDFIERLRKDRTSGPGDWLMAERDGQPVGTATALNQTMWVRGGAIPCQGVAYVGTVRTARRRSGTEPGVGTAVMREVLRAGRERGFVVSALMPFRGSYYDHFGYAVMEHRCDWTLPLSILPDGDFTGVRLYEPADRPQLEACRQRIAQAGQCDIERTPAAWDKYLSQIGEGFLFVDAEPSGCIQGWMYFEHVHQNGPDLLRTEFDTSYEDTGTLKRFLHFLASLRDQYTSATLQTPCDLPLNLLLKESQMTHRASRNHPTPEMRPFTRMQVRVLDHVKLLDAMNPPFWCNGKVNVAIRETEGTTTKLAIEIGGSKAFARPTEASVDVEMSDRHWAMIALGDLPATRAAAMGLIDVANPSSLSVLDAFAVGPAPYCREYF